MSKQQIVKLSIEKLDILLKSMKEIKMNENDILNQIIDDNRYIDLFNNDGETVLHYACYMGYSRLVTTILSEITDISYTSMINKQDRWGFTPLHRACSRQFINIAILLINKGAISNINYREFFSEEKAVHWGYFGSKGSEKYHDPCSIQYKNTPCDLLDTFEAKKIYQDQVKAYAEEKFENEISNIQLQRTINLNNDLLNIRKKNDEVCNKNKLLLAEENRNRFNVYSK